MVQSGERQKSNLLPRVLTAVLLLPGLALVHYGGILAVSLYLAVTVMMAMEGLMVAGKPFASPLNAISIIAVISPGMVVLLDMIGMVSVDPFYVIIAASLALVILHASWISRLMMIAIMLTGFCFIELTMRGSQLWLLLMLAVVIATDTGAYFGGRFFGGPKLAPAISPAKTWSGALCGLVLGGIMASLVAPVLTLPLQTAVILGIIIADFSIGGDLLESWFKRHHKVKDSGRLLPGHGGLLDRFDGYLLAAPMIYAAVVFGGIDG